MPNSPSSTTRHLSSRRQIRADYIRWGALVSVLIEAVCWAAPAGSRGLAALVTCEGSVKTKCKIIITAAEFQSCCCQPSGKTHTHTLTHTRRETHTAANRGTVKCAACFAVLNNSLWNNSKGMGGGMNTTKQAHSPRVKVQPVPRTVCDPLDHIKLIYCIWTMQLVDCIGSWMSAWEDSS